LKITLIVNPVASSVKPKGRKAAEAALAGDHELTVVETTSRDHAKALAAQAAAEGAEVVVVLSGDGTLNEAANGLMGTGVALAPLPGGSTNVFARTIGVPNNIAKAAAQLRSSLAQGSIRDMPVGNVNGRRFLFHVGLGYDAEVVAQVEKRASLKRKIGQAIFVYASFATWTRHFDRKNPHFALRFPDGSSVEDGYYAVCMNTSPYTYLGPRGLTLSQDTGPGRGIAALTVRTLSLPTMFALFASAMGTGKRLRANRRVDHHSGLMNFKMVGHRPVPYQVDGDYLGEATELEITYEPEGLRLVAPA